MDKRTGFALCGAGEPNQQFPLGSGIIGQGREETYVTCYKCLKLDYINNLDNQQEIPTKEFIPSDLTPQTSNVDPSTYQRRRQHIMIPFGIQGAFGSDEELKDKKKVIEKMILKVNADTLLEKDFKEEIIERIQQWDDFYEDIKDGEESAIIIWTRYSPFRVGNKPNKSKPNVKMRTQKPRLDASDPNSLIEFDDMNLKSQKTDALKERKIREKQAKLQILNIGIRIMDMIRSGDEESVRELARRKDKVGQLAKRILTSKNKAALRKQLEQRLGIVANPKRLEYDSLQDLEQRHVNKKKVKVRRKKS